MVDPNALQLMKQAVAATRAGNREEAHQLIRASLRQDPVNETAWLVLASITSDNREKLLSLKKVLELNPNNTQAFKMVTEMGVDPQKLMAVKSQRPKPAPPPPDPMARLFAAEEADEPVSEVQAEDPADEVVADTEPPPAEEFPAEEPEAEIPVAETTGPPRPQPRPASFEERLSQAITAANTVANSYLERPAAPDNIQWVRKDGGRAAENEILLVRTAAFTGIGSITLVFLVVVGGALLRTPFVQALLSEDQRVSGLVEPTATPTPLTTPTNTPGFTPTPSLTPDAEATGEQGNAATNTPTPTIDPLIRPGDPNAIEPTEVFLPGVPDRAALDSAVLIDQESYNVAIPTLESAREATLGFDANIFYLEAIARARAGNPDEALDLLEEAEALRIERDPSDPAKEAILDAGFAEVYLRLGQEAQEEGTGLAAQYFSQVDQFAEDAIRLESRFAPVYLSWAERYRLANQYAQAQDVLTQGLQIEALRTDVRLIVASGEVFLEQGNYASANQQAFVALFIDPLSQQAHNLRTRVALLSDEPGTAVLYAQENLYYNPQDVRAWELLAEARTQEGNPDLALEALNEAIVISENTDQPVAVDAYEQRAEYYENRRQYDLALRDVRRLAEVTEDDGYRLREMRLNLLAGDPDAAQAIAQDFVEAGEQNGLVNLTLAEVQAANAGSPTEFEDILTLATNSINQLSADLQPVANTLRARAALQLDQGQNALNFIEAALDNDETAERQVLQGEILEANEDFAGALQAYERALFLDALYAADESVVEMALEGRERAENALQQAAIDATATAQAP